MAITLAQLNKIEKDAKKSYVIKNLLYEMPILEYLPFANVNSLRSVAIRWQTLPDVAFRKINEGYTPSEGDVEQVYESVYGLGGEIKYDRVFDKIKNTVTDLKRLHTDMKLASIAYKFNDHFINGDLAVENDGFEGIKKRIGYMPSSQKIGFAGASASVLDPTASVANARTFFNTLEDMASYTDRGNVQAWVGNRGFRWGVGRVARYINSTGGNWLDVTKDSFDREIPTLWGAPIVDIGTKKDQSTKIITDTEVAGDAGTDATSVYALAFNEQQGISGIELGGMDVYDPLSGGEQESTPTKLLRIDWWLGLAGFGSYGFTRGWNLEAPGSWT